MPRIFDKQRYFNWSIGGTDGGTLRREALRECKSCGKFTKTNTKKLSHWDRHCANCGEEYG